MLCDGALNSNKDVARGARHLRDRETQAGKAESKLGMVSIFSEHNAIRSLQFSFLVVLQCGTRQGVQEKVAPKTKHQTQACRASALPGDKQYSPCLDPPPREVLVRILNLHHLKSLNSCELQYF